MNSKTINLLGLIIKIIIIAGILILGFAMMFSGVNIESEKSEVLAFREGFVLTAATTFSYIVIGLTALLVLVFFLGLLVTDPKKAIKSIIGVLVAVALFFILYFIGSGDTQESLRLKEPQTQSVFDGTNAGLITGYIALGGAVLAIVAGVIMKAIGR